MSKVSSKGWLSAPVPAETQTPMESYRSSSVGEALLHTLNSMIESKELSFVEATLILEEFDVSFPVNLQQNLMRDVRCSSTDMQGTVESFNSRDGLWRVDAQDVTLCIDSKRRKYDHARLLIQLN